MNTTVLVTGAAGYIGSILCERLLWDGYRVIAVDNLRYGSANLNHLVYEDSTNHFTFYKGDVRDKSFMHSLLQKADIIFPLAAIVGASACEKNHRDASEINVEAIRDILEKRSPSQLLIYPNTNSGYGISKNKEALTEEDPLNPISNYGILKVQIEKEVLEEKGTISFRLATVFGASPRMRIDLLVNDFVYKAITDGYLTIYEKDFVRNYIHVRDVAEAFIFAIENADLMINNVFNLGLSSANLTKEDLANLIKIYVPDLYIHYAEMKKDPDQRNYIISNQKLKDVGFEAKRSIDEGIKELIKVYSMLGRKDMANV